MRPRFKNLPRRIVLTFRYEGLPGVVRRSARFVLRLTPLRRLMSADLDMHRRIRKARSWYRRKGRPVIVIVPAYGDPQPTIAAVRSIRRTTRGKDMEVVVVDDGSPPDVQAKLRAELDCEVVLATENAGFAHNVNRVLEPLGAASERDVVLLNNDVVAHRHWLETLQHAACASQPVGIAGPKLLYPDGRIQSAGSYRNLDASEWFDHRFRFKPADYGPSNVAATCIGVTGACMYLPREILRELGGLDAGFGMGFEDMDYCLRAWKAGHRIYYEPASVLTHAESVSRGTEQGQRELESLARFWNRWGDLLDRRSVRTVNGKLRITYVTQDTGVGGGHRNIFEQMNSLVDRGHDVALYSLDGPPDWFDLRAPVLAFKDFAELATDLSERNTIKVATWWATAEPVWLASVRHGIPAYLVSDIETSYYPDSLGMQNEVLASYREEFDYMTISEWNRDRLRELGREPTLMPCGVDRTAFKPLPGFPREENVILAVGRSLHLKNLKLTIDAWRLLPEPRPQLWLFGVEPELGPRYGARYFERPTDEEVNELYNRATVFVQTSTHEGFCLPVLEAMAAGATVVATDMHGNRGWCVDEVNCLMPESTREAVAAALARALRHEGMREALRSQGFETAAQLDQERLGERLETFFEGVAARREGSPAALRETA